MQRVTTSWGGLLKSFHRDMRGTIAVVFGMSAIPIAIAASIAVDMANSSEIKSQLQAAADTAVLAAATKLGGNASDGDKEAIALTTFYANLSPKVQSQLTASPLVDIDFPTKTVSMTVTVNTNPVLGTLVTDEIALRVTAAATVSPGTPVCMMALNKHVEKSINIQGTTDLLADGCAVHVNSSHKPKALYQTGSSTAQADSFCVHGGFEGTNFTPPPHHCYVEEDPIAAKFASDWEASGIESMGCDYSNLPQINTDAITYLEPGVYCGGLNIKKGVVQLETGGLYVFRDGPLDVQAQGTLQGAEVAIIFTGDDTTRLVTQAGADIITTARTGENDLFRGLAFAQEPNSVPASENLIIGGGDIDINGIMYFPTQPLKVTGNGEIGTNAAQFAIIADTVSIEGNGQLRIKIGQNYATTGLPDLPESQEVVYLLE